MLRVITGGRSEEQRPHYRDVRLPAAGAVMLGSTKQARAQNEHTRISAFRHGCLSGSCHFRQGQMAQQRLWPMARYWISGSISHGSWGWAESAETGRFTALYRDDSLCCLFLLNFFTVAIQLHKRSVLLRKIGGLESKGSIITRSSLNEGTTGYDTGYSLALALSPPSCCNKGSFCCGPTTATQEHAFIWVGQYC